MLLRQTDFVGEFEEEFVEIVRVALWSLSLTIQHCSLLQHQTVEAQSSKKNFDEEDVYAFFSFFKAYYPYGYPWLGAQVEEREALIGQMNERAPPPVVTASAGYWPKQV